MEGRGPGAGRLWVRLCQFCRTAIMEAVVLSGGRAAGPRMWRLARPGVCQWAGLQPMAGGRDWELAPGRAEPELPSSRLYVPEVSPGKKDGAAPASGWLTDLNCANAPRISHFHRGWGWPWLSGHTTSLCGSVWVLHAHQEGSCSSAKQACILFPWPSSRIDSVGQACQIPL